MSRLAASNNSAVDRRRAVRDAMCRLVARRGFHGASMSAVAAEAGVATGTAYLYYASKDELIIATYVDLKQRLGHAATDGLADRIAPRQRFEHMWRATLTFLVADPDRARFLLAVENSPFAERAQQEVLADHGDALLAQAARPDMADTLIDLPLPLVYDLALGPAVRLVAAERDLTASQTHTLIECCWRAVTRSAGEPGPVTGCP